MSGGEVVTGLAVVWAAVMVGFGLLVIVFEVVFWGAAESAPDPDRCRQHPDVDDCWDQHGYYGMREQ